MFTVVKKVRVLLTELLKLRVAAKAGQCLIQGRARFKSRKKNGDINPLAPRIGERGGKSV
jgi:hypothetical protein